MQTVEAGGAGEVVISFPLHPHRGAGSQTSAKHKPLFDLGNSPPAHEVSQYGMSTLLHRWQRLMLPKNHLHMQQPVTRMNFIQDEAKLLSTSNLGFSAKKLRLESHKGKEKRCSRATLKGRDIHQC